MEYQDVSQKYRNRLFSPRARGFKYLDELIHSHRDSVFLNSDVILLDSEEEEYKNGIEFEEGRLFIDAGGYTIDARAKTSIFSFDAEVYITNAVIKNGLDAISNTGAVMFKDCCFLNNNGTISNEGKLKVERCTFSQNRNEGGVGGAIVHKGGDFEIAMSSFEGNCASSAGAIFSSGNGILAGCKFRQNQAEYAGALCSKGDLKILDCRFEENRTIGDAGAISNRNADMIISRSIFKQNIAMKGGGAVINHGNLSVEDCDFRDNGAKLCGGAIENFCNLKIFESFFEYNGSGLRGGAISSDGGTLEISNSIFSGNRGAVGDEICISKNDVLKLEKCKLDKDNIAFKERYPHCNFSG